MTGGQQPIGNPYRFLSHFFCIPGNLCATPIVTHGEGSFSYQGVSTRGVRHSPGLDGPIHANRFADSRESLDFRESREASRTEPLFCESHFGALRLVNRRFEAIRANRLDVMKMGSFLRIDSRESIRANRRAIYIYIYRYSRGK